MLGVVLRLGREHWALCSQCGDLMQVTHEKWTNRGLSCMNHPHGGEFAADDYQSMAFAHLRQLVASTARGLARRQRSLLHHTQGQRHLSRDDQLRALQVVVRGCRWSAHPYVLEEALPCAFCQDRRAATVPWTRKCLVAYDVHLRWHRVPLCDGDLALIKGFVPSAARLSLQAPIFLMASMDPTAVDHDAEGCVAPVALDMLWADLTKFAGYRRAATAAADERRLTRLAAEVDARLLQQGGSLVTRADVASLVRLEKEVAAVPMRDWKRLWVSQPHLRMLHESWPLTPTNSAERLEMLRTLLLALQHVRRAKTSVA